MANDAAVDQATWESFNAPTPQEEQPDPVSWAAFNGNPGAADMDPAVKAHFENSFKATIEANKPTGENAGPPKPFTFTDALAAGWQNSSTGLIKRGKMPDEQLPADASRAQRIAYQATSMAGDLPAMVAGGVLGFGGTILTGPGSGVGATAGAMALPAALRAVYIDQYTKGDNFKSPQDFVERVGGIFLDTAKGYVTGAATAMGGAGATSLAGKAALGPIATTLADKAGQVTAMTTVAAALDGRIPHPNDFIDAAIVVGGLGAAEHVAGKMGEIYKQTGQMPADVAQAAQTDASIKTDILSDKPIPDAYKDQIDPMFKPEQPAGIQVPEPILATPPDGGPTEFDTAQKNILDKVLVGGETEKQGYTFQHFYRDFVDQYSPIKDAVAAMTDGEKVNVENNPYSLMRLNAGSFARADKFLQMGTTDFKTLSTNGSSLAEVLDPVKEDLDGLRAHVVAKRALELEARGIKSGFDPADAKAVVDSPEAAKYDKVAADLVDYQNRVTKYLRDSGVIDKKTYDTMLDANKAYVPFYRVFEEDQGQYALPKGQTIKNPIKAIKGSERDVIDPIESIIKNTYSYVSLADRNEAGRAFIKLAEQTKIPEQFAEKIPTPIKPVTIGDKEMAKFLKDNGIDDVPDEALTVFRAARQPLGSDQIAVFDKGKREVYQLSPDVAQAFKGIDPVFNKGIFKYMSGLTKMFRAGTVSNVDFFPRHIIRQQINAAITSPTGFIPFVDTVRGAASMIGDEDLYEQFMASGAGNAEYTALDRRYIQEGIGRIEGKTSIADWIEATKDDPMSLTKLPYNTLATTVDALHATVTISENAMRLRQFQKSMEASADQGVEGRAAILRAGLDARNTGLDFARAGVKGRVINQFWPFFNLRIQGIDNMATTIRDHPLRTAYRVGGLIAVPTAALWLAQHNDSRWKDIPDWERDNFWIILGDDWRQPKEGDVPPMADDMTRTNAAGQREYNFGAIYRIPKPQEWGIMVGSTIERFLDFALERNPDAVNKWGVDMMKDFLPELAPTPAIPVIEQWANKSLFTGGSIIPSGAEHVLPEYQYTPYTTETAKALGHLIAAVPSVGVQPGSIASPAVVENYVRQWTGGLGMYVLQIADAGLRKAGVVPDPVKPSPALSDIPFVKAFVVRYPSASTQTVQDFYDGYNTLTNVQNTVDRLIKQGDVRSINEAMKVRQANPVAAKAMAAVHDTLQKQEAFIKYVYANPEMKPQEKRQLIDGAYYQMIQVARSGNEQMKALAASMAGDSP